MTLNEIRELTANETPPELEVHSVDPMIYIIFERRGEQLVPVTDSRGKHLQFRSRFTALNALRETGLPSAGFVHKSSYGEMIGMEGDWHDAELRETINLQRLR